MSAVNKTMTTSSAPKEKMTIVIKIIFYAVFIACIIGLFYYCSIDKTNPTDSEDPVFIENWTTTTPFGEKITTGSSYRNSGYRFGSFSMESTLPDDLTDDQNLYFIVGGNVYVYVDGILRRDFVEARDIPVPGGCVKRFYLRVPLYSSDSGKTVKIVRINTSRSGYVYQNTLIADNGSFLSFMMSRYGLSFMLEEILLIFSFALVIASLVMMFIYRRRIEMLYGSLSIFVISGWLITNSFLFPFIYGHYHIDGIINYMLCLMMPFSMMFYLDILQKDRYHRIMTGLLCVAALNLIIWPILHFTETVRFPKALLTIDIFLGAELLTVAVILVLETIRGLIKEYIYTAIGFVGFFICALLEIVVLNLLPLINGDILMLAGLAFMLILMVIQQIADIRRVREEGRKAVDLSEAKTRFLASMSHEIRTPINAVLGMNEMILRENRDPVIAEYAGSVKSSGQMLLMLVNDVLDFSKIEAGKMEISNAEFSFSSVLHDIMPMMKERSDEKQLSLQLEIGKDIPDGMVSDEFRIRQILINLISNAVKYTDSGSVTLTLKGKYTGDDSYLLRMDVKDTGRGIRSDDIEHLFEAFSRADIKKNRSIEGTGLGLAIVKNIIDSMNGKISVESSYGEGSDFIVELPVTVFDRTPLSDDYDRKESLVDSRNSGCDYTAPDASILAVDDNSSNLRIVSLFLKRSLIKPELCDSGKKAIELCRTKHYDLILLDHMMPDPDGIKTLGIIRSDEQSLNKDTPAVVLTANAIAGSNRLYLEAGFVDYLTKPIDSSLLEKTIKKYLPEEKIIPSDRPVAEADTAPVSLREGLERIEGLDYETAIDYAAGDEELLMDMIEAVVSECDENTEKIREYFLAENWEDYMIVTHAIKGLMLSIGLKSLSERAKKHEFAARDNDISFIRKDCEPFLEAYIEICKKLKQI